MSMYRVLATVRLHLTAGTWPAPATDAEAATLQDTFHKVWPDTVVLEPGGTAYVDAGLFKLPPDGEYTAGRLTWQVSDIYPVDAEDGTVTPEVVGAQIAALIQQPTFSPDGGTTLISVSPVRIESVEPYEVLYTIPQDDGLPPVLGVYGLG